MCFAEIVAVFRQICTDISCSYAKFFIRLPEFFHKSNVEKHIQHIDNEIYT